MDFDWKAMLGTVAPAITGILGTPAAGLAVKAGLSVFGIESSGDHKKDEKQLAIALQNATHEQMVELKKADQAFSLKMEEIGIDKAKLERLRDKDFIDDTSDARHVHADNKAVLQLGFWIIAIFFVIMGFVLYGCYGVITGGIVVKDAGVFGAVTGVIGTVIGYSAANAQQVVAFCFGANRGENKKTDALAGSISAFSKNTNNG